MIRGSEPASEARRPGCSSTTTTTTLLVPALNDERRGGAGTTRYSTVAAPAAVAAGRRQQHQRQQQQSAEITDSHRHRYARISSTSSIQPPRDWTPHLALKRSPSPAEVEQLASNSTTTTTNDQPTTNDQRRRHVFHMSCVAALELFRNPVLSLPISPTHTSLRSPEPQRRSLSRQPPPPPTTLCTSSPHLDPSAIQSIAVPPPPPPPFQPRTTTHPRHSLSLS